MLKFVFILLFVSSISAQNKSTVAEFLKNKFQNQSVSMDHKCGTYYEMQVLQDWQNLPQSEKQTFLNALQMVPVREKSMQFGNFTMHWDETGNNAVPQEDLQGNGIPDYIDSAAVFFNHVWQVEIDEMGFQPPLDENGQPVTNYDIYFTDFSYYGLTTFADFDDDIPSIPGIQWTSYIEVENDYQESFFFTKGLDALRVTAAHEFNHAIQFGYNIWFDGGSPIDFYFFEMTATWLEDVLYPDVNDYFAYLPNFFSLVSNMSFNSFSGLFPYGNSLYLHMLGKKYGAGVVPEIWQEIKVRPSLEAIAAALANPPVNSSLAGSLGEYAVWLYYTGDRASPGEYFTDASVFPKLTVKSTDKISATDSKSPERVIQPRATRYLEVRDAGSVNYQLIVTTDVTGNGLFHVLTENNASTAKPVNDYIDLFEFSQDTIMIAITNTDGSENNYKINFRVTSGLQLSDLYPNPVNLGAGVKKITFRNLDDNAEILILNASGKRVIKLINNQAGSLSWNLRTDSGEAVASGIYIYLIKLKGKQRSGKFAVVR